MTPTPLVTRLTRLLDVIQRVHECKRTVAARVIAERIGVSYGTIHGIAGGDRRYLHHPHYDAPLSQLESKYRLPLRALVAFESACARKRVAA